MAASTPSVLIAPGATAFTRRPRGARSSAMARVRFTRPPLLALYAALPCSANRPCTLATFTTAAPCGSRSTSARVSSSGAVRFTLSVRAQPRSLTSSTLPCAPWYAALFTRTCTPPSSRAARTIRSRPAAVLTSAFTRRCPRRTGGRFTSALSTRHPRSAYSSATARPMPRAAPVTTTPLVSVMPSVSRTPARLGRRHKTRSSGGGGWAVGSGKRGGPPTAFASVGLSVGGGCWGGGRPPAHFPHPVYLRLASISAGTISLMSPTMP